VASLRSCSLNLHFVNFKFNTDRFIDHWNIQLSKTYKCNCITSVVHFIILLNNSLFAVSDFLFAHLQKGYTTGLGQFGAAVSATYTAPAVSCLATHANLINHSYLNLRHSHTRLSNLRTHWLTKNAHQELRSVYSEPCSCVPVFFSAYLNCTLTRMLCKII